jgi:hypothetical protein
MWYSTWNSLLDLSDAKQYHPTVVVNSLTSNLTYFLRKCLKSPRLLRCPRKKFIDTITTEHTCINWYQLNSAWKLFHWRASCFYTYQSGIISSNNIVARRISKSRSTQASRNVGSRHFALIDFRNVLRFCKGSFCRMGNDFIKTLSLTAKIATNHWSKACGFIKVILKVKNMLTMWIFSCCYLYFQVQSVSENYRQKYG